MKTISLILCGILSSALLSGCAAVVIAGAGAAGGASQVSGDRRTVGSMIDDSAIESVANKEIEMIDEIGYDRSSIGTTSVNGILLVHGQTSSKLIIKNLERTCLKIKGVKKVYNALTLTDNVGFGQSSQDTWLTTKVKTKLIGESNVRSNSIKVVTEDGVVYLLGLVNKNEGATAAQIAANTDGVKKVITLFEYVSDDTQESNKNTKSSKKQEDTVSVGPSEEVLNSDTIEVTDL